MMLSLACSQSAEGLYGGLFPSASVLASLSFRHLFIFLSFLSFYFVLSLLWFSLSRFFCLGEYGWICGSYVSMWVVIACHSFRHLFIFLSFLSILFCLCCSSLYLLFSFFLVFSGVNTFGFVDVMCLCGQYLSVIHFVIYSYFLLFFFLFLFPFIVFLSISYV